MNKTLALISLTGLLLGGCAGADKPKPSASAPAAPVDPAVAEQKREAKERPDVKIGPDVIVAKDISVVWPILIKVEDWGTWMPKVTKVEPGAGLSPGAIIKWQFDEKPVESEIVTVTENQEFDFKSCASSKKALVKWTLKTMGPKSTLISLRAEVPYGTASETMAKLGPELNEWISGLQAAAMKVKDEDDSGDDQ